MTKKQNNLGTYLALTAGLGCASSVASGAIQVVDLSGISGPFNTNDGPFDLDNGGTGDFTIGNNSAWGYLKRSNGAYFHGDTADLGVGFAAAYSSTADRAFPSDSDGFAAWYSPGPPASVDPNSAIGRNWIAFKTAENKYGWLAFTLTTLGPNSGNPLNSLDFFVYDDASTEVANAISLGTAVSAVPEPSGLSLLALGSLGLAAKRSRKTVYPTRG